jgi:type IV pilus assembly PilX-like protein
VIGPHQRGATLAVGLILLTLVTLLGLAGASAAHVERQLAQNEAFRENAASAASAGIEMAILEIVNSEPAAVPARLADRVPGTSDRFEVSIRFAGFESALPQAPGTRAAGAHFEIVSTGFGARRAMDRQRVGIMRVVESTDLPDVRGVDCEPLVSRHCHVPGELERLSWQRVPVE